MGILSSLFGSGKKAAQAATQASNVAAQGQQQALGFLQQREQIPQNALQGLAAYFQVPGQAPGQAELISQAQGSPLYQAIMGQRGSGEEAILRNASATGGLRSGNTNAALSDYSMQLENQALLQAYNEAQGRSDYERNLNLSGLGDLASMSNAPGIAQLMEAIGQTKGQGIIGAAQAREQGRQNTFNNILGLGGLALGFAGLPGMGGAAGAGGASGMMSGGMMSGTSRGFIPGISKI